MIHPNWLAFQIHLERIYLPRHSPFLPQTKKRGKYERVMILDATLRSACTAVMANKKIRSFCAFAGNYQIYSCSLDVSSSPKAQENEEPSPVPNAPAG